MTNVERVERDIDCYITPQLRCKKPYLTDDMILQAFRDELKLDLVTGKRVA